MICGYSFTWTPIIKGEKVTNLVYGNGSRLWLLGMSINTRHQLAPEIPEFLFCFYNLTFAVITPALICGSFADRYSSNIFFDYCSQIFFMISQE